MSILRDAVRRKVAHKIGAKTRLCLSTSRLDKEQLSQIGQYLGTRSPRIIVETAFVIVAVRNFDDSQGVFEQISYDQVSSLLSSVTGKASGDLKVKVLRWALLASSKALTASGGGGKTTLEDTVNKVLLMCRETLERSLRI